MRAPPSSTFTQATATGPVSSPRAWTRRRARSWEQLRSFRGDSVRDPTTRQCSGVTSGQKRWLLVATVPGSSMAFIDGTVVNVALPALQHALAADMRGVQWIIEAYTLALAAFLLVGGAAALARGCRTRSALAPRRGSQVRRVAHFAQVERLSALLHSVLRERLVSARRRGTAK